MEACIRTERLILRSFTEEDIDAVFEILADERANRFLPWFPVKDREEAEAFYRERLAPTRDAEERGGGGLSYAICRKEDNRPIGYIDISAGDSHELGYGLRHEYWNRGIATEACRAILEQAKEEGIPFVMATHDRENPASGRVMQKAGLVYRYSYREQWMPKNYPVVFRLYQINFTAAPEYVYRGLWDKYPEHLVEQILRVKPK